VHSTIDLAGRLKFGPDAEYVERIDYAVDPARGAAFYHSARRFWPGLPDDSLQPGYAGIRPKLIAPGEPWRDFAIDGPAQHGVAGLVQLYGIESPGLTACLALADLVAAM
jgi:L-2-hydroxyglutarate oxidase LhgO